MTNVSHVHTSLHQPIRHIVAFSAKPGAVKEVMDGLAMLANIPGVHNFSVSKNLKLDSGSHDMDVVLYAEFINEEDLESFKHHAIYEKCTQAVRPLRNQRMVLDFK